MQSEGIDVVDPKETPSTPRRRGRRRVNRLLVGVIAFGLGATGLSAAAAASLGGLTSRDLGADNIGVTSCDTDGVSVAYTEAFDSSSGRSVVSGVTVSGLATACSGSTLQVTLADASGSSLSTGSALIGGASQAVTLVTAADAELVTNAAIVVTG